MTDVKYMMKAKMKGTAFLFALLTSALLIVGARAGIASNSHAAGTSCKTQSPQNLSGPASRLLIADRTDTEDRITYGTDPGMERAMEDQEQLEKEKEEKAWQAAVYEYL